MFYFRYRKLHCGHTRESGLAKIGTTIWRRDFIGNGWSMGQRSGKYYHRGILLKIAYITNSRRL